MTETETASPTLEPQVGNAVYVPFFVVPPTVPPPVTVYLDPHLPQGLRQSMNLPDRYQLVDQPDQAVLRLEVGNQPRTAVWIHALAAPFSSLKTGVSSEALRQAWSGAGQANPIGVILLTENTLAVFSAWWGEPAPGVVEVIPEQALLETAWGREDALALLPFEALEPRWKVLEVDGQSPLRNNFDPQMYALTVPLALSGDPALAPGFAYYMPGTNRDPSRLTVVAMTGVTALVRATAFAMERNGILYPGKDVRDWLRAADLTHISNEVPFAQNCPYPNPTQEGMRFCSDPRYIALLEDVGADVIELTGDHFQDWGNAAMVFTLDLYRQRGWGIYGGGANLAEAQRPLLVEHNGNRLAFIGCNAKGGAFAQAGPEHPGAVVCGSWMEETIAALRGQGVLPIATFQHYEYYTYQSQPNQERDSRRLAEAGAVIVSGSQAHQPQSLEFYQGALIHYGLGNLFFDQFGVSKACRQGFIDRHVFYDGRYIGAELLPIQFVDYARARPMTAAEQEDLLDTVFTASGW
jgi:poly-gamma-glutamate synthesis protein (capsule biosynthesis protein)